MIFEEFLVRVFFLKIYRRKDRVSDWFIARQESFQVTIRHEIQEARELTTLAIRAPQRTI